MILGIDPGAHGAIALLDDGGAVVALHDMPTIEVVSGSKKRTRVSFQVLANVVRKSVADRAVIERVGSMPGQGVASSFAFGYAAGGIEGVFAALNIPIELVSPVTWKRELRLPADKGMARQVATRLWPAHAASFARVRDDGRAEAALIAHWWLMVRRNARIAA